MGSPALFFGFSLLNAARQIPDPPGHQGRPVIKDGARVSPARNAARFCNHLQPNYRMRVSAEATQKDILAKPDEKAVALKARRSDELKMKRAWDLALS